MNLRNLVLIFASLVFGANESDLSPTIFGTLTYISLYYKRFYAHFQEFFQIEKTCKTFFLSG